jgi:hypothetical protein
MHNLGVGRVMNFLPVQGPWLAKSDCVQELKFIPAASARPEEAGACFSGFFEEITYFFSQLVQK